MIEGGNGNPTRLVPHLHVMGKGTKIEKSAWSNGPSARTRPSGVEGSMLWGRSVGSESFTGVKSVGSEL